MIPASRCCRENPLRSPKEVSIPRLCRLLRAVAQYQVRGTVELLKHRIAERMVGA